MWKETVAKRGPQAAGPGKERKALRVRVSAALQTSEEPTDSKDPLSLLGHLLTHVCQGVLFAAIRIP